MRGALLFGAIALIALVLQTAVLPIHGAPDLLLIMCVYLGLRQHSVGGAVGAFFLGYLQDTFSGTTVGLNAFAMSLVFTVVYLTSRRLWVDNAISKVVVVFLAAILKTVAILALVAVFLSGEGGWASLVQSLLMQAVLAALLSPPVFAILAQTHLLAAAGDE
ncbi:MAG TPA: rod shape-determining protein MreD [Candidatus Acidoferrales bacterium]|nr:rod shape-determining protein MreD [Candidatus Acidoferrales bacterium]